MRTDGPSTWTRERLIYLTIGVIIVLVGLALILTSL
jgi:hypothetical protein